MSRKTDPTDDADDNRTEPIEPLVSVADVPKYAFPVKDTEESRLYALKETADEFVTDGGCDSYEETIKGLLGENSAIRCLQSDGRPDTTVQPEGDGGSDFTYHGSTVDVKTVGRHRDAPALTVDAYGPKADYYVLAHRIGTTSCRLLGYAPRRTVKTSPIQFHRGEPYHIVRQHKLFPFPQTLNDR